LVAHGASVLQASVFWVISLLVGVIGMSTAVFWFK